MRAVCRYPEPRWTFLRAGNLRRDTVLSRNAFQRPSYMGELLPGRTVAKKRFFGNGHDRFKVGHQIIVYLVLVAGGITTDNDILVLIPKLGWIMKEAPYSVQYAARRRRGDGTHCPREVLYQPQPQTPSDIVV